MNRADFHKLTEIRIKEAKVLLDNACFEGAYYLAGYAVECALKACIAKQTNRHDFPPTLDEVRDVYTHQLTRLLKAARLTNPYQSEYQSNANFKSNWDTVKDWSEQKRYDL